ncbi:hypothetical protein K470DRAFT_292129 [Piedraia hortae CBS 480.64]|uniref:Uncharacterized protein n=1 Tax=Piedraia hortae CBS 480.64 TaxID=1314780 RepID=A0A6A7CAC9_9PEZI|nr:hypothetical protein K470DRAFT_292129 [Piedraia hortae CBS 480.64]
MTGPMGLELDGVGLVGEDSCEGRATGLDAVARVLLGAAAADAITVVSGSATLVERKMRAATVILGIAAVLASLAFDFLQEIEKASVQAHRDEPFVSVEPRELILGDILMEAGHQVRANGEVVCSLAKVDPFASKEVARLQPAQTTGWSSRCLPTWDEDEDVATCLELSQPNQKRVGLLVTKCVRGRAWIQVLHSVAYSRIGLLKWKCRWWSYAGVLGLHGPSELCKLPIEHLSRGRQVTVKYGPQVLLLTAAKLHIDSAAGHVSRRSEQVLHKGCWSRHSPQPFCSPSPS